MTSNVGTKKLGAFLATMLVAGNMIGSGVYLLPASLGAVGSISVLGWLAAIGGAALLGGAFSALTILRPTGTGLIIHVREAFGPGSAFIWGVLYWFACWTGNVAIALAVTGYLGYFIPEVSTPPGATIATVGVLWLFTAANIIGPRFVARLEGGTLLLGLAPVLLIALGRLVLFRSRHLRRFVERHRQKRVRRGAAIGGAGVLGLPRRRMRQYRRPLGEEPDARRADRHAGRVGDRRFGLYVGLHRHLRHSAGRRSRRFQRALRRRRQAAGRRFAGGGRGALRHDQGLGHGGRLDPGQRRDLGRDEVLGLLLRRPPKRRNGGPSVANLLFNGVLMSAAAVATANPSLGRQFTVVADLSVILCMFLYSLACFALIRLSAERSPRWRLVARGLAVGAVLFCGWVASVSETQLLEWSGFTILAVILGYLPLAWWRRSGVDLPKEEIAGR